eukprot:3236110-Prymnesium_polylepis.2
MACTLRQSTAVRVSRWKLVQAALAGKRTPALLGEAAGRRRRCGEAAWRPTQDSLSSDRMMTITRLEERRRSAIHTAVAYTRRN